MGGVKCVGGGGGGGGFIKEFFYNLIESGASKREWRINSSSDDCAPSTFLASERLGCSCCCCIVLKSEMPCGANVDDVVVTHYLHSPCKVPFTVSHTCDPHLRSYRFCFSFLLDVSVC